MSQRTNRHYLLNEQYKNAANLQARLALHQRFSTSTQSWFDWIFDHFAIAAGSHILELGCGSGEFWRKNLDRIPSDWSITLSDFSAGMLEEARQNLHHSTHPFTFQVIDAQSVPLEDECVDVVIANHMLYHVPDRPKALAEMRRILKPTGHFYATTIGQSHLDEIDDLLQRLAKTHVFGEEFRHAFTLEDGYDQLTPYFSQITLDRFPDALRVTEVEPLIAYILSTSARQRLTEDQVQTLRQIVEHEIATAGAIHITKSSGIFMATKG